MARCLAFIAMERKCDKVSNSVRCSDSVVCACVLLFEQSVRLEMRRISTYLTRTRTDRAQPYCSSLVLKSCASNRRSVLTRDAIPFKLASFFANFYFFPLRDHVCHADSDETAHSRSRQCPIQSHVRSHSDTSHITTPAPT